MLNSGKDVEERSRGLTVVEHLRVTFLVLMILFFTTPIPLNSGQEVEQWLRG